MIPTMATRSRALLALVDTDRTALAATVATIRDRWPVERVILFGSKARGDDDSESDIDLLGTASAPPKRPTDVYPDLVAGDIGLHLAEYGGRQAGDRAAWSSSIAFLAER
jgi:hypothetical protein